MQKYILIALFLWVFYACGKICYGIGFLCGRYGIMSVIIQLFSLMVGVFATVPVNTFDMQYMPFYAEGKGDVEFLIIVLSAIMNVHLMRHGFRDGEQKRAIAK